MRIRAIIFFFMLMVFYSSTSVQAGWFDFLFPVPPRSGENPAETLRAPFADSDAVIEDLDAQGNAQKMTPLYLRHRPNEIITKWVEDTLPALLSYNTNSYNQQYGQKIVNLSKSGVDEYLRFLQEKNFITTLKTGRYDITGFVKNTPVVINEGSVDGRYLWLYEANVMVTYLQTGISDYRKLDEQSSVTKDFTIRFQVGRVLEAPNEHGVLIETWSLRSR